MLKYAKNILPILFIFFTVSSFSQTGKKKHVITHNKVTIVTNPASGQNSYPAWGIFPSKDEPVRKIIMHLTLGAPDSLASTAHWDYNDHINILNVDGKGQKLEIGRMLTPYGSIYSKGWEFTWSVDVTDFSMLLRDKVEIEYVHSGYEPQSVGWALTIDFEITEGPEHITPLSIQPMWMGSYDYGNPDNPIEKTLTPITFNKNEKAALSRFRIQHTGHGFDRPKHCSEFCSRWRMIKFKGDVVQNKDLWKNCGDNPLYPQGGTWIFDRALWCPGDLQQPDIVDVWPTSVENNFEIVMEPYVATANIQAKEDIASCLIQYSAPLNKNDVEIVSVIAPNNDPFFNRSNPNCFNAKIKIRNLGRDNLKSLTIKYGTEGMEMKTYKWKGNLPYFASEEIILPGKIDVAGEENIFVVDCSKPNGKKDAWRGDNVLKTTFDAPKQLPEEFIVQYKTNSTPEENNVFILNEKGDTVFHKKAGTLQAETVYNDTLELQAASYEMYLTDSTGNGLEFWFMKQQGHGYIRLFDMNGSLLHKFQSDCGDGEMLAFTTSPDFEKDSCDVLYDFVVYPKVISDKFSLDFYSEKEVEMEVILMQLGIPVEKYMYPKTKGGKYNYDISHLKDGRYIVEIRVDGIEKYKARVNKSKTW